MTQYYSRKDYNYAGDSNFTIPFSYIDKNDISVYVNNTLITTWSWLNNSQINIESTLHSGDVVSIRRITPIDEKIVTYQNMSMVLSDKNLNLSQDQILNAVQEVYDNNEIFGQAAYTALNNANAAVETANLANSKADNAISVSSSANSKSDTALSLATTASSESAEALATANDASSTANTASDKVDSFGTSIETVIDAATKINELEEAIEQCKEYADLASKGFGFRTISINDWVLGQDGKYRISLDIPIILGVYNQNKELLTGINIKTTIHNGSEITSRYTFNGYILVSAKNVEFEDENNFTPEELEDLVVDDWDDI